MLLIKNGFSDEVEIAREGLCPFCHRKIDPKTEFVDDLSVTEYNISGLCQKCQDGFFTDNPDPSFCTERRELYISVTRAKEDFFVFD